MSEPLVRRTLDRAEVAAALGVSLDWFAHKHRQLARDHGFPSPLPLVKRWDPLAIKLWQDRQLADDLRAPEPPASPAALALVGGTDAGAEDEMDQVLAARGAALVTRR